MDDKAFMPTGLAHIGVFVRDIEASKDFYGKLGFTLDEECANGSTQILFFHLGDCRIELICPADTARFSGRGLGYVDHFALCCGDIERAIAEYKAIGLIPAEAEAQFLPSLQGGIKNLFFTGPSGERIELVEPAKR